MVSSYRNSSSTSILVARTTQMILPHNIQYQQINMENCPACRRVPRQCSPTYVDPSAAAGGYFIAHLHRQAQIFRYHLVDEHLACIFHSATFCNKKKVLQCKQTKFTSDIWSRMTWYDTIHHFIVKK